MQNEIIDTQLRPLIEQMRSICEANNIHMVLAFETMQRTLENGDEVRGLYSAAHMSVDAGNILQAMYALTIGEIAIALMYAAASQPLEGAPPGTSVN